MWDHPPHTNHPPQPIFLEALWTCYCTFNYFYMAWESPGGETYGYIPSQINWTNFTKPNILNQIYKANYLKCKESNWPNLLNQNCQTKLIESICKSNILKQIYQFESTNKIHHSWSTVLLDLIYLSRSSKSSLLNHLNIINWIYMQQNFEKQIFNTESGKPNLIEVKPNPSLSWAWPSSAPACFGHISAI